MSSYNKKLILEDGSEYLGYGFGADKEAVCEIVFNTSMAGYQEIISDPSYTDQAIVMSYPLIGNYGITDEDFESKMISLGALIVREVNEFPSNFRFTRTLSELLEDSDVPGVCGRQFRPEQHFRHEQPGRAGGQRDHQRMHRQLLLCIHQPG